MTEVRSDILMECGHTNNGAYTMKPKPSTRSNGDDEGGAKIGDPVCVICVGIDPGARTVVNDKPDLTDRVAVCSTCGKCEKPSTWDLAFFEFQGPGSRYATKRCKNCPYTKESHKYGDRYATHMDGKLGDYNPHTCKARGKSFEPRGPLDEDKYYCGCRGWN